MTGKLARIALLVRRSAEVLAHEGPESFLARARRRLVADDRRIHWRYPRWAARQARAKAPAARDLLASVVTPVCDPPIDVLRACAASVLRQEGARVEWCVADDASSRPEVRAELDRIAARDPRVKLVKLDARRGIAGATNAALELARGDVVFFVDHDDELDRRAVAWMLPAFDDAAVAMAYSDEDKLGLDGERCWPFLKPGWSSDLHLSCNYVSHLLAARRALVDDVGRLRSECDGSQDYDLALRLSERGRVAHVPRVLYHWRMTPGSVATQPRAKEYAYAAARRALSEALARRGIEGAVEDGPWIGSYRVRRELARPLDVSLVLSGNFAKRRRARLARASGVRETLVAGEARGAIAAAARAAKGDVIILLDADLVPSDGALRELATHAQRADVAVATGLVVTSDRRIETSGLVLGLGTRGIAACPWRGRHEGDPGYFGLASIARDVSAAPTACLAIEKKKLDALGGLAADLDDVHVGVELCARASLAGLRTIFTPFASFKRMTPRAVHDLERADSSARVRARLGDRLARDPHLSPCFARGKTRLELPV